MDNYQTTQQIWKELQEIDKEWGLATEVLTTLIQNIQEGNELEEAFNHACLEWDV